MKICLYTDTALPSVGGLEFVVDHLARAYEAAGHEVTVLAPRPSQLAFPEDGAFGYRVVRFAPFVSTQHGIAWYVQPLLRAHRRYGFDIVHAHSLYPMAYLALLARRRTGVPVVVTSHGGDVAEGCRWLRKPRVTPRLRWAIREVDAIISIGAYIRERLAAVEPAAARVVDVPNGVETEELATPVTRPAGVADEVRANDYVLFIGRLRRRKGVDVLLRALEMMREAERPRVVVAGDGPEGPALRRLSTDLGLDGAVRFVGRVDGDVKRWLYQNARAVVVPSRGWEGLPLVVLEAFAAGCPPIASDLAAHRDVIDHWRNGLLFEPESAEALAGVLREALRDAEQLAALRRGAREAAAQYAWPQISQRHLALYDEVLATNAAALTNTGAARR